MNKTDIRTKYRALRKALSAEQIEEDSLNIANQLLKLEIWDKSYYHIFLTIAEQKELNTDYILNVLAGKDKNIILSKSDFLDYSMAHYLLTDSTRIKKNDYNIPEPVDGIAIQPQQIDVVFVPLLAFDTVGHRIGYGMGFYDRFLNTCKEDIIKIGLSSFKAESTTFKSLQTDIKLDYAVTPNQIYRF